MSGPDFEVLANFELHYAVDAVVPMMLLVIAGIGVVGSLWLAGAGWREDDRVLKGVFLWGAFGVTLPAIWIWRVCSEHLPGIIPGEDARRVFALLVSPVVEELLKFIVIPVICLFSRYSMRSISSGVLLGLTVGLAFGMTESCFALQQASQTGNLLWPVFLLRVLGTIPMHAVAAAIPCVALAGARVGFQMGFGRVGAALLVAMLLHAGWNLLAFGELILERRELLLVGCAVMTVLFVATVAGYAGALRIERARFGVNVERLVATGALTVEQADELLADGFFRMPARAALRVGRLVAARGDLATEINDRQFAAARARWR